ncbi:MAG: DUF4261 domain-containing protein [Ruminococcus sp.]|nr:DUF4261 domain-containing protein [Ruminococcus sp.]
MKNIIFLGFALLYRPEWDTERFIKHLRTRWNIISESIDVKDQIVVFNYSGAVVSAAFIPERVPNDEADQNAIFNYMWKDAAAETRRHTAQVIISVNAGTISAADAGKLFVKTAESCLDSDNAAGLYMNGSVYEPAFYIRAASLMDDGEYPVHAVIWHGLAQNDDGSIRAYTSGLENFGSDEIEVLDCHDSPLELLNFVTGITSYIVATGAVMKDGETIGFSEDQKLSITKSASVEFDGRESLKIEYPGN